MTLTNDTRASRSEHAEDDLQKLKEWLSMQPHLPPNIEDELLRCFVLGTKSLEIAKQKLDGWLTSRENLPQLFSEEARNIRTNQWKDGCEAVKMYTLPKTTTEGYRVIWYQPNNLEKFDYIQMTVKSTMVTDMMMKLHPEMKGLIAVYDFKGVPFSLMSKLNIAVSAGALNWIQNTVPIRLKKIIVVNAPSFAPKIVNTIFKPFMKEKTFNRITLTEKCESYLRTIIPEEIIPEDYGGKEKHSDILDDEWNTILYENYDWFKEISSLKSDDKKRPPDALNTYGVEGTFRSLAID